jgi:hypothetical protein
MPQFAPKGVRVHYRRVRSVGHDGSAIPAGSRDNPQRGAAIRQAPPLGAPFSAVANRVGLACNGNESWNDALT